MNQFRQLLDILSWSHRERACKRRGYHRGTPMTDPIACTDCGSTNRAVLLGPNGMR